MHPRKQIERRIELLLDEAYRAGEQAREILIQDQTSMSQFLALQKIEYGASLAVKHLRWALSVVYSSQQE